MSTVGHSLSSAERAVVRAAPLFRGLGDDAADALIDGMRHAEVPRGDVLYRSGDAGDCLYVVLGGCLQVYREDRYGRVQVLELVTRGGLVGELSWIDREPRTATVAALHDAEVAALDDARLDGVLESDPRVAVELLRYFSRRLRRANEGIADMALMDVRARVAKMVLELAARFGRAEAAGIDVYHGLSQEDLARYVGASREMVNRALADLQARRVLQLRPGGMLVLRRGDLQP